MNKWFSRIILPMLLLSLLLPFAGCGEEKPVDPVKSGENKVVFSFRGETITESEFGYYLSLYKGRFA